MYSKSLHELLWRDMLTVNAHLGSEQKDFIEHIDWLFDVPLGTEGIEDAAAESIILLHHFHITLIVCVIQDAT